MSKICSRCKIEKDEREFYKNQRKPDGLDYYCKACRNKANTGYIIKRSSSELHHNNGFRDTPEQIQICLNCTKPECNNCLTTR